MTDRHVSVAMGEFYGSFGTDFDWRRIVYPMNYSEFPSGEDEEFEFKTEGNEDEAEEEYSDQEEEEEEEEEEEKSNSDDAKGLPWDELALFDDMPRDLLDPSLITSWAHRRVKTGEKRYRMGAHTRMKESDSDSLTDSSSEFDLPESGYGFGEESIAEAERLEFGTAVIYDEKDEEPQKKATKREIDASIRSRGNQERREAEIRLWDRLEYSESSAEAGN